MMTIAWNQARIGDVLEVESRNYGKIRGVVRDVSEPGFPKPIDLTTNYGSFVLYRDTSPQLTVVARGATYPALGDFSIFG